MLIERSITSSSSGFDALVLAHLRRANIKAQLIANHTNYAATALRQGWIDAETALGIVAECGLLNFVLPGPSS